MLNMSISMVYKWTDIKVGLCAYDWSANIPNI